MPVQGLRPFDEASRTRRPVSNRVRIFAGRLGKFLESRRENGNDQ
jgi:hypothetical protein